MHSKNTNPSKIKLWSVLFWLAVWQIASLAFGQPILLSSPLATLWKLWELIRTADFWQAIFFSMLRIAMGFFGGVTVGILLAGLSVRLKWLKELLKPLMLVIKTIPVASFIILVLIWISSRYLSVFISFIMVLPIIYTNVLEGIEHTRKELLEMAEVFRIPFWKKIRYIYLAEILPFLKSAMILGLGLCWKSGIAAEVIGIPRGSIGEKLYNAKIYINTSELFAWTFVIVCISLVFEKLVLYLLEWLIKRLERISY